jgi:alcohol dehydrogenase, propanol-preferring
MATTVPNPKQSGQGVAGYHAAVVREFGEPLSLEQVPRRALEPAQIRVKVEAWGLCHTDIHAARGDWPVKPSPPFIPGHEGVGIVQELGPGVTDVACGDRVAMPWVGYACGTCDYCVSGWETLCESQENMGYSIDGAFGEFATGRTTVIREVRPLTRVNESIADVECGRVAARIVFAP